MKSAMQMEIPVPTIQQMPVEPSKVLPELLAAYLRSGGRFANPYFAIEVEGQHLRILRDGLLRAIASDGMFCEEASQDLHVSIAYARGSTDREHVENIALQMASAPFEVHVDQFAILEGEATPFDYLVLCLGHSPDFSNAVSVVERNLSIRKFHGGFKSHISLLRFPKGELSKSHAKRLVRELNASRGVALALGRAVCLEGRCVCIYTEDRQAICRVPCRCVESPSVEILGAAGTGSIAQGAESFSTF